MRFQLAILALAFFYSCGSNSYHSYQDYERVFKSTRFDKTVISKIQLYDSLERLILRNLDSLIPDDIEIYDIKNLTALHPALSIQFQKAFQQIGTNYIDKFTLSKDTILSFTIRETYDRSIDSYMTETLSPKRDNAEEKGSYPFLKDTLINRKWVYSIHVDAKNDI
jgi:hypothetical protein